MDMMQEQLRLRDNKELSGSTAYWFSLHKTKEEYYDFDTDPYNLTNRIGFADSEVVQIKTGRR